MDLNSCREKIDDIISTIFKILINNFKFHKPILIVIEHQHANSFFYFRSWLNYVLTSPLFLNTQITYVSNLGDRSIFSRQFWIKTSTIQSLDLFKQPHQIKLFNLQSHQV